MLRDQGPLEALRARVGPPRAEQRLVREGPLEAHAIQGVLGRFELGRLEEQRPEHQVRLVPDREGRRIRTLHPACPVQLAERLLATPVLEQGDAEVVGLEALEALRGREALQHRDGVGRSIEGHVDVGAEELDVAADVLGDLAPDPVQDAQGSVRLVLLEVDARQPEGRVVSHRLLDVAR
jgi:hypothetical protein